MTQRHQLFRRKESILDSLSRTCRRFRSLCRRGWRRRRRLVIVTSRVATWHI